MNRRLLPVAVLVALAVPAATAGNAHAIAGNGKCKISKKWGILKRTAEVVVFVVERREEAQGLYACYKANGRRAQLAEASDDGLTSSASFDLVQAKGHFVAWQFTLTDDSCKAACPPGYEGTTYRLSRADLKTRRLLRWEGAHVEGSALKLSADRQRRVDSGDHDAERLRGPRGRHRWQPGDRRGRDRHHLARVARDDAVVAERRGAQDGDAAVAASLPRTPRISSR